MLEIERESSWTKTLADRLPESCVGARHEAVVERGQVSELVTTPDVIESVMTSPYGDEFEEIVAADGSTVYVHEGDVGPGGVYDGTAYLIVADGRDVNVGVIESDDPALVDRLSETFEECRDAATRLTASELGDGQESVRAES